MDEEIDVIERDIMWKFSDPSKGGQPIIRIWLRTSWLLR